MSDKDQITNIRFLYIDGKIRMRLYAGDKYEDASISPGCLALAVGDGARILHSVLQEKS
jgi:hypothetical protein